MVLRGVLFYSALRHIWLVTFAFHRALDVSRERAALTEPDPGSGGDETWLQDTGDIWRWRLQTANFSLESPKVAGRQTSATEACNKSDAKLMLSRSYSRGGGSPETVVLVINSLPHSPQSLTKPGFSPHRRPEMSSFDVD